MRMVALSAVGALLFAGCSGDSDDTSGSASGGAGGGQKVTVMIASSGEAETNAVTTAANAWATESGNTVEVIPAQDLEQQLAQGFAGGSPPDVFYVGPNAIGTYAKAGSLYAYGDDFPTKDQFIDSLKQTFTYDGKLQCIPKDFSTLGLFVNMDMWADAGLTEADIPTTWDQLATVAKKVSTDKVAGLTLSPSIERIGSFMWQAKGWWMNEDSTQMTADTPENLKALEFVKGLLVDGSLRYPVDVSAGWGGEAFGLGNAVMAVEGNWLKGGMKSDYPNVNYKVFELPAGDQQGTQSFTNCWGIASASKVQAAAVSLVEYLTTPEQQMTFAKEFGVMPSNEEALAEYEKAFPEDSAFVKGVAYAHPPSNAAGMTSVLKEFDAGLEGLKTNDPAKLLADFQKNGEAVLNK